MQPLEEERPNLHIKCGNTRTASRTPDTYTIFQLGLMTQDAGTASSIHREPGPCTTDAAAIASSGGDGGMSEDIHTGKRRQTPNQNGALISTGQQLLKLVIAAGVKVLWCKVKGHSQDAINDRADALATDGRDAVTEPRGLELAPPHQLHTVEDWLSRSAGPEVACMAWLTGIPVPL